MPTSAGLLPVSPPGPITWTKPSPRRQAQWRRPDARRAQTAPRDARRPQQTGQIVQLPSASPRARTTQPTAREEARGALPEVATTGATFTKRQPSLLEVSKRVRVGTRLTQASEKSYRSLLRLLHAPQQRLAPAGARVLVQCRHFRSVGCRWLAGRDHFRAIGR